MKLQYVFVHGFAGWGSYDARYQKMYTLAGTVIRAIALRKENHV